MSASTMSRISAAAACSALPVACCPARGDVAACSPFCCPGKNKPTIFIHFSFKCSERKPEKRETKETNLFLFLLLFSFGHGDIFLRSTQKAKSVNCAREFLFNWTNLQSKKHLITLACQQKKEEPEMSIEDLD